jgi:hypothetical protein
MNNNSFLNIKLNLDLAESYMYGTASCNGESYAINIQSGKPQLILPKEIYQYFDSNILHADFKTEEEKDIKIDLPARTGRDMIEIYDDRLALETAWNGGDLPVSVQLIGISNNNNEST